MIRAVKLRLLFQQWTFRMRFSQKNQEKIGIRGPLKYFSPKEQKIVLVGGDLVQHLFIFGKKHKKEDCEVTIIIGARTKDLLFC